MYRIFAALALAGVLAACSSSGGGSPLTSTDSVGVGTCNQPLVSDEAECATDDNTSAPPADPSDPDVYARQFSDDLTVSGMSYDTASGELVLDNVPFDRRLQPGRRPGHQPLCQLRLRRCGGAAPERRRIAAQRQPELCLPG